MIEAGVRHGYVLGPSLFLLYINDIVNPLQSITRLLADDIDNSLFVQLSNINEIETTLNHNLNNIHIWAKQWLVSFNFAKTSYVFQ